MNQQQLKGVRAKIRRRLSGTSSDDFLNAADDAAEKS